MHGPILTLAGIQVDNDTNRAFAEAHGAVPDTWPQPYAGSVVAECAGCGGAVWLGPELQKQRSAHGGWVKILCLLCVALVARDLGADITMLRLSDKKSGE